jgi:chromosome segregation ATPase
MNPKSERPATRSGDAVDIEKLKARYAELDRARTTAQANLDNAQKQLDEAKAEARTHYGTDDLDVLRQKLADMKAENERKRAEYQEHLEQVQSKLAEVEKAFAGK